MSAAVLFDLFGTLVPSPPRDGYREVVDGIAAIVGLPADDFFDRWMSVNDGRLRGVFGSSEGEIAEVVGMFGQSLSSDMMVRCVEIRRGAMASWLIPKPGSMEALDELGNSGFRLALVSDCVFDVPAVWPQSSFARLLPVAVFSCELGIRKPDPRIYLTALERLGAEPSSALFVGDGGSNELVGARQVGINSLLLDDQPEDQSKVLRVDVHGWDGPSVTRIGDVVQEARALRERMAKPRELRPF